MLLEGIVAPSLDRIEEDLGRQGLVPPKTARGRLQELCALAFFAVSGLGILKLIVAVGRGKSNIGFLLILLVVYTAAVLVLLLPPRRTAAGRRYLAWLQDSHKGLRDLLASGRREGAGEVALAAGIFGLGALPILADLNLALEPPPRRKESGGGGESGCGSGDSGGGGSSCGGGGDGGGSGCGGGGCGGGAVADLPFLGAGVELPRGMAMGGDPPPRRVGSGRVHPGRRGGSGGGARPPPDSRRRARAPPRHRPLAGERRGARSRTAAPSPASPRRSRLPGSRSTSPSPGPGASRSAISLPSPSPARRWDRGAQRGRAQAGAAGMPILLENIAYPFVLPGAEMTEAEFVRAVSRRRTPAPPARPGERPRQRPQSRVRSHRLPGEPPAGTGRRGPPRRRGRERRPVCGLPHPAGARGVLGAAGMAGAPGAVRARDHRAGRRPAALRGAPRRGPAGRKDPPCRWLTCSAIWPPAWPAGSGAEGCDREALDRARAAWNPSAAAPRAVSCPVFGRLWVRTGADRSAEHAARYNPAGMLHHVDDAWDWPRRSFAKAIPVCPRRPRTT